MEILEINYEELKKKVRHVESEKELKQIIPENYLHHLSTQWWCWESRGGFVVKVLDGIGYLPYDYITEKEKRMKMKEMCRFSYEYAEGIHNTIHYFQEFLTEIENFEKGIVKYKIGSFGVFMANMLLQGKFPHNIESIDVPYEEGVIHPCISLAVPYKGTLGYFLMHFDEESMLVPYVESAVGGEEILNIKDIRLMRDSQDVLDYLKDDIKKSIKILHEIMKPYRLRLIVGYKKSV